MTCKYYMTPQQSLDGDQCGHGQNFYGRCAAGICPLNYSRKWIKAFRMALVKEVNDGHK